MGNYKEKRKRMRLVWVIMGWLLAAIGFIQVVFNVFGLDTKMTGVDIFAVIWMVTFTIVTVIWLCSYYFDGFTKFLRRVIWCIELEPTRDMYGWEVLDYFVRNTSLRTKRQIETALMEMAYEDKIAVWAMHLNHEARLRIPAETFRRHTFNLEARNKFHAQDLNFPYDENNANMIGRICLIGEAGKSVYDMPQFCRAQIKKQWPPTRKATDPW